MRRKLAVNLIKYGCCALFVGLTVWVFIALRETEELKLVDMKLVDQYLILCDAFTVPGVLLILFGAMVWVSNQGALDGLAYCVRFAVFSLIPGKRLERDEKYGEYVERKSQNRLKGYGFLFWSGLATMAIALVFMVLFYHVYE